MKFKYLFFLLIVGLAACNSGKKESSPSVDIPSQGYIITEDYTEQSFKERKRNIRIYLPPDYTESGEGFPVMFMMDGQNLFYDSTSFAGEWHIDETMDKMVKSGLPGSIIVGIDHAEEERLREYNPYDHKEYGTGEGKDFLRWIVDTLVPDIYDRYNVTDDPAKVGVGGASMGGLIALYGLNEYPKVFGHAALFSVSFPIAPESFLLTDYLTTDSRFMMATGAKEDRMMVAGMGEFSREYKYRDAPPENYRFEIVPDAEHNEAFWDSQFNKYYQWIAKSW